MDINKSTRNEHCSYCNEETLQVMKYFGLSEEMASVLSPRFPYAIHHMDFEAWQCTKCGNFEPDDMINPEKQARASLARYLACENIKEGLQA